MKLLLDSCVWGGSLICIHILSLHKEELQSGAIITAEPGRLRIRPH